MTHRGIFCTMFFATLAMLWGCTGEPKKEIDPGVEVVSQSIVAHGGFDTWKNLKTISYKKTIILFDSLGSEESRTVQYHNYSFKPEVKMTIQWYTGKDSVRIEHEGGESVRYVNGSPQLSEEAKEGAASAIRSSTFVLFQPFKLLDPGTELSFVVRDTLEENMIVDVVQPSFKGAERNSDKWWFYFDQKSRECVANMVEHDGRYSYIVNLKFDRSTPLLFNSHRKSYFTDSKRNIRYLRAEYYYEDFDLTLNEPVE